MSAFAIKGGKKSYLNLKSPEMTFKSYSILSKHLILVELNVINMLILILKIHLLSPTWIK